MRRRCTMPSASHPFHRSCSGSGDCTGLVFRRVDALTAGEIAGPRPPPTSATTRLYGWRAPSAGASGVARQLPIIRSSATAATRLDRTDGRLTPPQCGAPAPCAPVSRPFSRLVRIGNGAGSPSFSLAASIRPTDASTRVSPILPSAKPFFRAALTGGSTCWGWWRRVPPPRPARRPCQSRSCGRGRAGDAPAPARPRSTPKPSWSPRPTPRRRLASRRSDCPYG